MIKKTLFAAALLATAVGTAQAAPVAYKLDPAHMSVAFIVNHLGFSTSKGRFSDVASTLTLDEANPAASKVTATIKVASLDTGFAFSSTVPR